MDIDQTLKNNRYSGSQSDKWLFLEKAVKRNRSDSRLQVAEVSKANAKAIEQLIEIARDLLEKNQSKDAQAIIEIIQTLLNNNQKLQQVVGDAFLRSH